MEEISVTNYDEEFSLQVLHGEGGGAAGEEEYTEAPRLGTALPGPCPVDCNKQFYLFLVVMCFIKFTGSTGRATNFLVSVRRVGGGGGG